MRDEHEESKLSTAYTKEVLLKDSGHMGIFEDLVTLSSNILNFT